MILYFSGTGNSRYCAQMFAEKLGEPAVDMGELLRQKKTGTFRSETPWIFVSPTYAWQLPHVLEQWIRRSHFIGSRDAYFVMTCGDDIGAAGEKLKKLCRYMGFTYRGVLETVMPENYVAMFPVPEKEEADLIVAAARPVLEQGMAWIREGKSFPEKTLHLPDRVKSGPINGLFYAFGVKAKPFFATDDCTGCGRCEALCPLGNISMEEGKAVRRPVWGKRCTHCMACICGCPSGAIEYGKRSKGKPRYRCIEYKEE